MLARGIADSFARTIGETFGVAGLEWLQRLPSLVDEYARRWSLVVGLPFDLLSYNWVAPAQRADGSQSVLKVGFPRPELSLEIAALRSYAGCGSVLLLEASQATGVLLLERLMPGTPLSREGDDRKAISTAVSVMRRLWRPAAEKSEFPSIAAWTQGLGQLRRRYQGGTGPLPARLVDAAESLVTELLSSAAAPVLLHGDLHLENILAAERERWIAIDPKGVIGEPTCEVGALVRDLWKRLPHQACTKLPLAHQVDQFADELGLDRSRIVGWALVQAVLSGWWSLEDHGRGWESAIACAEALSQLK